MSIVIGIIAIKGGVGKTSTVVSLGAALANEFKKKVLVVDANFSAPNLGLHLGYVKPERTIHDVLREKIPIEKAIYSSKYGFHVIAGSLLDETINPLRLKAKIEQIRGQYDLILLDSSPTLNEELQAVMHASDDLFVVTTPDYPTLSCTLRAVKIAKERKTPIRGLILNRVRGKSFELSLDEIEDMAKCRVVAVLPDDVGVLEALANCIPPTLHQQSEVAVEYKKLAAALINRTYTDPRWYKRLGSMLGQVGKHEINRELLRQEYGEKTP